jgi:hypothetical protein
VTAHNVTRPLLCSQVVVAVVIRVKERLATDGQTKLEAHLGVAYEVAVLFAIVHDRESGQTQRTGFRGGLDHESHLRRVLDLEVEVRPEASGPLKDLKDGLEDPRG